MCTHHDPPKPFLIAFMILWNIKDVSGWISFAKVVFGAIFKMAASENRAFCDNCKCAIFIDPNFKNIYFIEYLVISRHEEFTAIKILIFKYSFMPKSKIAAKFWHFPIKSHNFWTNQHRKMLFVSNPRFLLTRIPIRAKLIRFEHF